MVILALLLAVGGFVFTYEAGGYRWINHAFVGIVGLTLVGSVFVHGATLTRRMNIVKGANLFKRHKRIGIYYGFFMLLALFYGFWSTSWHHPLVMSLLTSVHSWLALTIVALAALQIVPSLLVKRRKRIRKSHMVLGYALFFLVIIQAAWGMIMIWKM